ncbi:MAG: hypothetical protein GEV10_18335 [Streptosporangiales bacterium]|nr:hypothetical protein [Streptosporangiales bacterium]
MFRNAAWVVKDGIEPADLQVTIPGNRPTLSFGATDQDHAGLGFDGDTSVSSLQWFLTFLGFPCAENGTFDQATDDAVRSFQTAENELAAAQGGFAVDGKVGRTTWAALGYVVPSYA